MALDSYAKFDANLLLYSSVKLVPEKLARLMAHLSMDIS